MSQIPYIADPELYATDAEIKTLGYRLRVGQVYGNVSILKGNRKVMVLGEESDARYYLKHRIAFVNQQAEMACAKK